MTELTPEQLDEGEALLDAMRGPSTPGSGRALALTKWLYENAPTLIQTARKLNVIRNEPVGCHGCTHVLCEDECELCAE